MKVAFDALERAYGSIEDEANEAALRVLRSGKYILRENVKLFSLLVSQEPARNGSTVKKGYGKWQSSPKMACY